MMDLAVSRKLIEFLLEKSNNMTYILIQNNNGGVMKESVLKFVVISLLSLLMVSCGANKEITRYENTDNSQKNLPHGGIVSEMLEQAREFYVTEFPSKIKIILPKLLLIMKPHYELSIILAITLE